MITRYFLCITGAFVLLFSSCDKKEETAQTQKQNSGVSENSQPKTSASGDRSSITYQLTGVTNGTMTIYRNGNELKQVIESDMMGLKSKNEVYVKGGFVYLITEINGKKLPMKTSLDEYNSRKLTGETIANAAEFEKMLAGKKVTGNESILGRDCEIYEMGNNVFLSIADKKHIMKIKSPELLAVATEISPLPDNSDGIFELPAGMEFKLFNPKANQPKESLDSAVKKEAVKK
ncbi:MAG: hypothetical protein K1X85_14915 [Ignavibacteria bacterium]|nr:hypothetical protein [Ignavibacteria bacterium]